MPDRLFEVGISTIHGDGQHGLAKDATQGLVRSALRSIDTNRLPVRCAILLATADWCGSNSELPGTVRRQLEAELSYTVPLIGASMAALYCSTDPMPVIRQGLSLIVLCSDGFWVSVDSVRHPYSTPTDRSSMFAKMATKLEAHAGDRLGSSAERYLFGFLPGPVTDEQGRRAYYDNELCQEILEAFGSRYRLIGASAADGLDPTIGYQFANDDCLTSGVAMGLVESDISTGSMLAHGLGPRNNLRVSVDGLAGDSRSGYEVTFLDGKPAAERLRELQESGLSKFGKPVFGLPCGADFQIIWPINSTGEGSDSIRLKRRVQLGDRLYVLEGAPAQLIKAGQDALNRAFARTHAERDSLSLILGFSCVGRLSYYGAQNTDVLQSLDRLRSDYPGIPMVGALSAGEFGIDRWRRSRSNNISVSVICLTDKYSRRARTRTLQKKLIDAASGLSIHDSPRKVMQAALEGAVDAGATGGQISVVEHSVDRILGRGHGFALQPRLSPQNWKAVAELTDWPAVQPGGALPSHLRDWVMPVVSDLPFQLEFTPSPGVREELLTLVVRTLHAVFIPDSRQERFYCDEESRTAGNIICQLAIPLVGSAQRVIATLQLSFPDETKLDRESFALWVSYAQKIVGALERAQEADERNIKDSINRFGNEIMREPVGRDASPHAWCNAYLDLVVRLLGADGAHIRVLEATSEGDELRLVGAEGCLSDILYLTRRVIRENEGVSSRALLKKGGKVSNTREDTADFNKVVKAVERAEEYGKALARRLADLECTAWLPLYEQERLQDSTAVNRLQPRLLGSMVLYSKRRYFFSDRIERIARAAADLAGIILLAKNAERKRAQLDQERDWIIDFINSATGKAAEQVLEPLVRRVCKHVGADVGSLFAWYEAPKKLVLHTSYNWHVSMEGKAKYDLNTDSWTGGLGLIKDDDAVRIVSPLSDQPCSKRYYDQMVPREHQVAQGESDARIGVRLAAGDKLVGVLTLSYYQEHRDLLVADDERIKDFLRAVTSLITLGLEVAKRDSLRKRMQNLVGSETQIVNIVLPDAGSPANWQSAVDSLCKFFNVERVTFYHVGPDKRVQLAWSSQPAKTVAVELSAPAEPVGAMADVVRRKEELTISNPKDQRLNGWPNKTDVEALFAIPLFVGKGDVLGVLEFVNREETRDHPFPFFDDMDKEIARDVARTLAAVLEQQLLQSAREELSSQLATATKIGASGLLGAIVMHNLMTPFANMQGSVDWLLRHPNSSEPERVKHLKRIAARVAQAVETIDYAAHRGAPGAQRVKLRAIVDRALRAVQPEMAHHGIKPKVENEIQVWVNVDLWSIVGAVVNLLSNALDALNRSGVLTVATAIFAPDVASIRIHNAGPVLSEADVAQFLRTGYTTKGEQHHLGLGLSLAKQAIEAAGGKLTILPSPGGGVEAIIYLPIAAETAKTDRSKGEKS